MMALELWLLNIWDTRAYCLIVCLLFIKRSWSCHRLRLSGSEGADAEVHDCRHDKGTEQYQLTLANQQEI